MPERTSGRRPNRTDWQDFDVNPAWATTMIALQTAPTPKRRIPLFMLEETGRSCELHTMSLDEAGLRSPVFLALNPARHGWLDRTAARPAIGRTMETPLA